MKSEELRVKNQNVKRQYTGKRLNDSSLFPLHS